MEPNLITVEILAGGLHEAFRRTDVVEQIGAYGLRRALESRALHVPWPRVVVEGRRKAELRTRAAAAQLAFGAEAVLAGRTAAALHGCSAAATPRTHVLLPYEQRVRSRSGLVVHRGRSYREDAEMREGLRVLALDRVVAHLLCRLPAPDALAVCDQALGLQSEECREAFRCRIGRRVDRRPDPRGTRQARDLLALATGRAESPPESWLLLRVVELGFPWPEVNWPLRSPWGQELYRLDLAWPELRIALEYHGYSVHAGRTAEDAARRAELERHGWIVEVAVAADLRDSRRLHAALRAAFSRRGYTW